MQAADSPTPSDLQYDYSPLAWVFYSICALHMQLRPMTRSASSMVGASTAREETRELKVLVRSVGRNSFPRVQEGSEGRRRGVTRRLVLTGGALLERRPATYEVAERRQLAALAAVVRFAAEPTWLALEWTDGAPAAMYILPGRDALLAALLDAAQACLRSSGWPYPFEAEAPVQSSSSGGNKQIFGSPQLPPCKQQLCALFLKALKPTRLCTHHC